MKTIKYLFIFIITILSFNCSKSDDDSEDTIDDLETLIIGDWKIESRTLNGEVVELSCTNGLSSIYTFNVTNYSYGIDVNDGNDCVTLAHSGTYSIDGNLVRINSPFSDGEVIWTVININETTFNFTYTYIDNPEDIYSETYRKL